MLKERSESKIIPSEEVGALVEDGATITVSSSSGLGCPDLVLRRIGEYFAATGHPRDVTSLHPIAAGDMYGIDGIDHLARRGLLKRILAGSYPSGPSSMESPEIWRMIHEDEVEAYNIPSGVLFDMHRDGVAGRPGSLTSVGMDTFADPRRNGCKMNAATTEDIVTVERVQGRDWLFFPAVHPDVAIVRGTTGDEVGNISMEHEGAYLGAVDQAMATKANGGIVIAQVKRTTKAGSIPPQQVHIPSMLVDYVVRDPDQMQTTETTYDPAISGEIRRPGTVAQPVPFGPEKVIARRAARELQAGRRVNLGFGISALVPHVLAETDEEDTVTWAIEQGAVGGLPLTGFAFGCAANPQAIVPSPQQFSFFQGGGLNQSLLSFMQVDGAGNVNVSKLAAKPHVTAGCGGFVDIVHGTPNLVFCGMFRAGGLDIDIEGGQLHIKHEGRHAKFVPSVEHVTFSGAWGLARDKNVLYVTERGVFRLTTRGIELVEVAPGIDPQRDIQDQAEIEITISPELREMDSRLFTPDPTSLVDSAHGRD